jgi:hypothetical protein
VATHFSRLLQHAWVTVGLFLFPGHHTGSNKSFVIDNYDTIYIPGCIQKFPDWVDNEINNNNKHSLRSNIKGYGGKTH